MAVLMAIMVIALLWGAYEAWNGHMGRCAILVLIGLVAAGYVVLQSFVPGAPR
jgi:hypothetical protein